MLRKWEDLEKIYRFGSSLFFVCGSVAYFLQDKQTATVFVLVAIYLILAAFYNAMKIKRGY